MTRKKQKLRKRIGSLLLCMSLVSSIMGMPAYAAYTEDTEDMSEAVVSEAPEDVTLPTDSETGAEETDAVEAEDVGTAEAEEETHVEEILEADENNVANVSASHIDTLDRVLIEDNFDQGNQGYWDVLNSNGTVSFTGGKAVFNGSGPCNRIGYNGDLIDADDFLIQLNMTLNEGNTNSNAKIAFKTADQYEGDRLQVRFNFVQGGIYVERTQNNSVINFTKVWSQGGDFTWETGKTYAIDVLVEGDQITVYVDGTEIISVTNADIQSMEKGYFAIAGQYPAQNFSIDDLCISTDEELSGELYTVTLQTATNGVIDSVPGSGGGTLTADKDSGYDGEKVTLSPVPAHNYVFDSYGFFLENGTSADGLITVINNTITLDSKFGNITVVAYFVSREPGAYELFYDDFAASEIDDAYKTVGDLSYIEQNSGELTIDAVANGSNYLLLDQSVFDEMTADGDYRISTDVKKGNATNGTMQIMFKGEDTSINGRYVLVLNGGAAVFRYIDPSNNTNIQLASTNFTFSNEYVHADVEVIGDTVTFYADDREILSYTTDDNWKNADNCVGLINMTGGAPVVFDELLVEQIPSAVDITLTVKLEENGSQTVDTDHVSGTVTADKTSAVSGETVTLTVVEKAGYQLKSITVNGEEISNLTFTVPSTVTDSLDIVAVFEPAQLRTPRNFYIDSENGDDSNSGTIDAPWKTLSQLEEYSQTYALVPGDQVLLKRGSVFENESLQFSGMGTEQNPIVISAYGDGEDLPRLDGNGVVENVISLFNQEYITISNLEITNTSPNYNSQFGLNTSTNTSLALRAINVSAKDFGVVSGIKIQDCYIHDINGNINLKWNGGIFFDVQADVIGGELSGIPTKYDDVLIEGCTFINVDRSGIKLVNSAWCNQWLPNSPDIPLNWYPSTNVVVRNNYMEKIGGDGITTRDTDGALIEYNLAKDCRYQNTGYNVGIWPFEAANTVIQYNEAYNTHGTQDGQGLDCDHASSYSLMQYNYSHDNEGGFMLIMGGYPHTAPTVRYNISQNDCDKTFEFAQGIPKGTMIYNNTIYSDQIVSRGVLFLSNTAAGLGVNDFYMFNNLFCYPDGQTFYGGGNASNITDLTNKGKLYNNAYVGGISAPVADTGAVVVADIDTVLVNAGSGPDSNPSTTPITGASGELDGYQLVAGSPMIDTGATMAESVTHFGGAMNEIVDGTAQSPNELYYQAQSADSIDYIMGEYFPEIAGVDYEVDFFGNSLYAGNGPDIGAAEYLNNSQS